MENAISIMVVDRDQATAEAVAQAIKEYPFQVLRCWSIDAVLDTVLQNKSVDLVLLDLQQPFAKTFDLLSELKNMAPQAEIVFVSRFDDEKPWIEAVQRGAYDFLPKPLDLLELKRVLIQAAEKHRAVRVKTVKAH